MSKVTEFKPKPAQRLITLEALSEVLAMKLLIPLVFGFAAFVIVGPSHGEEPTVRVKLQGHVTWSSFRGGEVDGEVVVAGNMCLVKVLGQHFGPIPGDGQGKIVALDAATGRWRVSLSLPCIDLMGR